MKYWRKAYTRSDGTRVQGTWVTVKTSGRSRGRKTGGRYSVKKGYSPWITRKGKLGGPGYLSKSSTERHRLLSKCVSEYGYRSCLGSVMVLSRNRSVQAVHGSKLTQDREWLKNKYGASKRSPKRAARSRRAPKKSRKPKSRSRARRSSR